MPLPDAFVALATKVNNWGRWGTDDEAGTVNFINADVVARAARCVRRGDAFPLAIPLSDDGPQVGLVPGRTNPKRRMYLLNHAHTGDPDTICFNDDAVDMALQAATHWDALAHVSYRGRIYNGFDAGSVTEAGASRCGIDKIGTLVSRGVLLDVARVKGVERLEGGYPISPADLDTAAAFAGVAVEAGDIILVRTGQMQLLHAGEKVRYTFPAPGLSMETAEWFHGHDVAAVATDTLTFEVYPGQDSSVELPVHLLHLVEMGLTQGQNFDLEVLAADCASDGVYTFLLDATPPPFIGGLGGPVNPVAVK